jgi:Protein of unknown function (DUF2905)
VFSDAGKIVVAAGLIIVGCGLLLMIFESGASSHWFNWFGNLPLDITIEKSNFRFYFPLGSSLQLSLLVSLLLFLLNKFIR